MRSCWPDLHSESPQLVLAMVLRDLLGLTSMCLTGYAMPFFSLKLWSSRFLPVPEKFAKMAEAMGENIVGLGAWEAAMKAVEAVRKLRKRINIPTIIGYGIDIKEYRGLIPQMVRDGIDSGSHRLNPRIPTEQDLTILYESVIQS